MTEPIVFNLPTAQEAQNRLDDGLYADDERPRLVELAAQYEGWCQQEYGRFQEECEQADRARWLAGQCGGCVDGGTGELCEEHWLASATEAELAAIDADGSPGDLYDPPPHPSFRLPCGSLRPHGRHDWVGQSTGDTYTCSGHSEPVAVAGRVCTSDAELAALADRRLAEANRNGTDDSWWEAGR